ncbi:MAG: glycosyltransferase [Planctomycetota bacterium]
MIPGADWAVVVPTASRPDRLAECLRSLLALQIDGGTPEIVVVDDGGDPPAQDAVDALADNGYDIAAIRVVRKTNGGPASARNAGVAETSRSWIAMTDDDCAVDPGWLTAFSHAAARHAGAEPLLGGAAVNAVPGLPAAAAQRLLDHLHEHLNTDPNRARFFPSNAIAMPRSAYLTLGGFSTAFRRAAGEDRLFCDAWRGSGRPLVWVPEARAQHRHALTFRGFWRQQSNYGRGAATYRKLAESQATQMPRGFRTSMLTQPVREQGPAGLPMVVMMLLSQAAVTSGYVLQRFFGERR